MADKRQHNSTMNAKGLDDAVDDDAARKMIETQGATSLLIVEVTHGPYVTAVDGTQRVNLVPGTVALVPDQHAGTVKALLRALALDTGQEGTFNLDDDAFVPSVDDAVDAVKAATPAKKTTAKKTTKKATAAPPATTATGLSAVPPLAPEPDPGAEDDAGVGPWPGDPDYVEGSAADGD